MMHEVACVLKDESEVKLSLDRFHLASLHGGMFIQFFDEDGDAKLCGPLKAAYHTKMVPVTVAIFPGQTQEDFK